MPTIDRRHGGVLRLHPLQRIPATLLAALVLAGCSSDEGGPTTPAGPAPHAVADLEVVAGADGSVTLAWRSPQSGDLAADKAAFSYDLRFTELGAEGADFGVWNPAVPAPSADPQPEILRQHTVTGLQADQAYVFALRSREGGGAWSKISNFAVGTAAPQHDTTPPAAAADLKIWASDLSSLTVAFSPCGDDTVYGQAAGYEIRYADYPLNAGNWSTATPGPAEPGTGTLPDRLYATIEGLEPETPYYVAVRARDDEGQMSGLSNLLQAVTVEKHTWYVTLDGTGDFPTIEAACDAARDGDVVLVGPGRYTWTNQGTGDAKYGLLLFPRVYPESDRDVLELRSTDGPEVTILDAEKHANVITVNGGELYGEGGVIYRAKVVIDGFTITGGIADAEPEDPERPWAGGGISLHLTDSEIRNCIITGNEATQGGGIVTAGQCGVLVEDCLIERNSAVWGGGIHLVYSEPRITIRNCTLRGNTAEQDGGGVFVYHATFTIENCLVTGNAAQVGGGGLSVQDMAEGAEMAGCTLAGNSGMLGSAVRLYSAHLEIDNSILAFNTKSGAFNAAAGSSLGMGCTDVFGHSSNQPPTGFTDRGGNFEADPLFCDTADYTLRAGSPCLPPLFPLPPDCGLIGARGQGCAR